jgi:diketogulonate reductase-like aldo/keto reductase
VIAALDEVANAQGSTPARVALAWLLAQPGITAPIASATNETTHRSRGSREVEAACGIDSETECGKLSELCGRGYG